MDSKFPNEHVLQLDQRIHQILLHLDIYPII